MAYQQVRSVELPVHHVGRADGNVRKYGVESGAPSEAEEVEVGPFAAAWRGNKVGRYALVVSPVLFILAVACWVMSGVGRGALPKLATSSGDDKFDSLGRYVMRNFDRVKPMSNFLSGLGGVWGVPMCAFYVNNVYWSQFSELA
jgi:hypothetical protein